MANNSQVIIKYTEIEVTGNTKTTKTYDITTGLGLLKLGTVWFNISKISDNHISINIPSSSEIPEENNNDKANFLKQKQFFSKTLLIPFKAHNLELGNWLDFTDGVTKKKYNIYITSILRRG